MSGGYFDYTQHRISDVADSIQDVIDNNSCDFKQETIDRFKEAIVINRKAAIFTQRIDWLFSGDDGEDSFHKRLAEELKEIK